MARIAIIGAGLSGLVVAHRRAAAGDRVTLFEADATTGGQLRTERSDGYVVEQGAEGFVAGSEAVRVLAADLGIEAELVGQLVTLSYFFDGHKLVALRSGEAGELLGFQVPNRELGRGIGSFRKGMGELAETLTRAIAGTVEQRLGTPVSRVSRAGSGVRVEHEPGGEEFDAVVVATPAAAASALLEPGFGAPAAELRASSALSSVTVSLAYARDAVEHALDATGFVVAEAAQDEGFRACTFTTSKLPERAPPGKVLLRAFFRPTDAELALSDAEWSSRAERCLGRALRLRNGPERTWVSRWARALPLIDAAHRARVEKLEAALDGTKIVLAGSAFYGSGIEVAVRSAEAASRRLG